MATPTGGFAGIVRYRSAFIQFTYTGGGAYFPYGGYVAWFVDQQFVGTSQYQPYAEACDGISITGLVPGTMYTVNINVFYYDASGNVGVAGSMQTTMTTLSRPAYFSWTVPKVQGEPFYLGASEWAGLINSIMNVLEYAGYIYSFTQTFPAAGELLTAARYNDLRAAIQTVPGYGYYVPQVSSGQIVTAQQLNLLVSELNAIP